MARTDQDYVDMAKTPEGCDNLILNAQRVGNEALVLLARQKKIMLLAALHGATTPIEEEAWNGIYAIEEYRRSKGQKVWRANYTRRSIQDRGGDIIATVDAAVSRKSPSDGFQEIIEAGLEQFLWERLVLRYPERFSERAIQQARARLGE